MVRSQVDMTIAVDLDQAKTNEQYTTMADVVYILI